MKGIVLAGGSGTRLHPLTLAVSKQLLPVYDKPMIYYPLSTLMLAGIRDILLISTPHDLPLFQHLLGDGSKWGINLNYAVQPSPDGLAQAFIIGREFLDGGPACLILGDNIFYADGLSETLQNAAKIQNGAQVFGYWVADPERYGVIEWESQPRGHARGSHGGGKVLSIIEKPAQPRSNYAVVGLYFYDAQISDIAAQVRPSERGELEITEVNNLYLQRDQLHATRLGRGAAWLDTGTHESLLEASNFIEVIEKRQGLKIACLEEIAYQMEWIGAEEVLEQARALGKTEYGRYLERLVK